MPNKPPFYLVVLDGKFVHSIHRDKNVAEQWAACKEFEGAHGQVDVVEMSADLADDLRSQLESEQ